MYEKPSNPEDEGAGYGFKSAGIKEKNVYFYHSDHLGSTTYITDMDGKATQFVSYKPYGEALVDEHATSFEMPWKFNGKEFDSETGLYYYGARYYEPALALWYGVDALAEKYPSVGGYVYCVGNPVRLVDVDGKWPGVTFLFQQAKLSLGIGYGLYVGCQNGVAWDDNGKTHYNMYAIYHFNNQKLYDGSREPTFLIEGSVDFLSGNVKHDWEHNTFIEAISDNAKCSLNIKLGANWGIAEDGVTLGIGCSIGADFF